MPDVTRLQAKDFSSDLDEIAREGARRMLAQALEAEIADYIARHQERDENGRAQVVRSQTLPPYMRRSPKVAEVLPILYLRGLSTGDFKEGLAALLGKEAAGLSPTAVPTVSAERARHDGANSSSLRADVPRFEPPRM